MKRNNVQEAIIKGLVINNNSDKYDNLVKIYKYLLEYYISSKVNLSKYDEMIKNSNLYIGVNNKYKGINEYLKLDYIFLINELYVEKLSIQDIDILLNKFDKDNINDEVINIISRTYKEVIYDNFKNNEYCNEKYKVFYGTAVPKNAVNNDSLVLKIYYGKNLINLDGDEFIELHKKQLAFFDELINNIKQEVFNNLNINCEVLLEKDIY